MADCANSTATSEVHELQGSTPPGAGTLDGLTAVHAPRAKPRPHPRRQPAPGLELHPSGLQDCTPEREVIALGKRLVEQVKMENRVRRKLHILRRHSLLEQQHRILLNVMRRVDNRIDRLIRALGRSKAPTSRAAAFKAAAMIQLACAKVEREHELARLGVSLAHDAGHLHVEMSCLPQIPGGNFGAYHEAILKAHADMNALPLDRTDADADVFMDRWAEIDRMALADRPKTFADAIGALLYARREVNQFHVEEQEWANGEAVRIKGLKSYRHPKTGRLYTYHRATGTRIMAEAGTPAFLAEVAAIDAKTVAPRKPAAGTLGLVVEAYRRSPAWADLSPATRVSYDRAFAVLAPIGAMPIASIDRPFVVGLQEKVFHGRGRWMANYVVPVLSILSEYAMDRGWAKANPADGVKRLKPARDKVRANRPWSKHEAGAVMGALPAYLRVPVALAMYGGFRKSDVLKVTKAAVRDGLIEVMTSKRGVLVRVPVHPDLAAVLAAAPRHDAVTIAANQAGQPWTVSGYDSTFGKAIERLEKAGTVEPGLTMHGLRHTLGTRLREAGADLDDIRRILGQKTLVMAQHYSETADTSERARAVVERLDLTRKRDG